MDIEKFGNLIIAILTIFAFGIIAWSLHHEFELEKEIIAKSEEYVTYNYCTEVHGKYYCK